MNPIAAILDSIVLYRYSLIVALAAAAGVCCFMACCSYAQLPSFRACITVFLAVVLSLPLARLFYWYGRPNGFSSLRQAVTAPNTEAFALAGAMAGCTLAALLSGMPAKMLDCMSVAGCGAMALGRLGCFFSDSNRGQIMTHFTSLPWAVPVATASGQVEYRFATFLFQAAVAAALGLSLAVLFLRRRQRPGEIAMLFVLFYSASQVILDSTRYDSLYFPGNGFISIVQVFAAVALVAVLAYLCIRAVKKLGWKRWMPPLWLMLTALLAGVGYMEYYVQRHGLEAAFAYSVMGTCLALLVGLGLCLWHLSREFQTDSMAMVETEPK